MVSSDEMQQRILAELEECAAVLELVTLLNTVIADRQGHPNELTLFREAMEQLIEKGLVLMAPQNEPGQRVVEVDAGQSSAMVSEVLEPLFFGADDLHWTADPFVTTYAVLTESGRRAGAKLLDERGYEWWYDDADDRTA
jgi:hypothetical protein